VLLMTDQAGDQPSPRIVVDIWSDVMCPFCYLGDALLGRALEGFAHREAVSVEYHSFLLMPQLSPDSAIGLTELLVTQRGLPADRAEQMNAQIARRGTLLGLDYRFDIALATNTRRAHELSHFAKAQGQGPQMVRRLFQAYFTQGANLSDRAVLAGLAADIGLDPHAAAAALASGQYAADVDHDIATARRLQISGVPFFVFNHTYAINGAQPLEVFTETLDTLWAEAASTPPAQ
jgi:predicted DsbA family dithiol-disulfide isomerase